MERRPADKERRISLELEFLEKWHVDLVVRSLDGETANHPRESLLNILDVILGDGCCIKDHNQIVEGNNGETCGNEREWQGFIDAGLIWLCSPRSVPFLPLFIIS